MMIPSLLSALTIRRHFVYFVFVGFLGTFLLYFTLRITYLVPSPSTSLNVDYRRRLECTCLRHELPPFSSQLSLNQSEIPASLCNSYATRRGPHQRVISISLFGPKENKMFQFNRSLIFLDALIADMNLIYSDGFLLRIYHDNTINVSQVVCPLECKHPNIDFCDMNHMLFVPPKIWRFLPAGDLLVDIMMSRDLDSALTPRERAAVDQWLAENTSFHAMRDHPMHGVPMLGGMWGFRPTHDPATSRMILDKIRNRDLVKHYGGRGDQTFLAREIWPKAKSSIVVHDSFLCQNGYGNKPKPFPTQRPSANQTNCFVGCVRPCCGRGKMPFGECPKACRPKDHPEWSYC